MRLFLSAMENNPRSVGIMDYMDEHGEKMLWNLISYCYVQKNHSKKSGSDGVPERIRDSSELLMVDSGAHSFQKGTKVDWEKYTHEYAAWIRRFDRPNVVVYFEMDVDNIIGYKEVKRLRKILEVESGLPEKIIPVWHKNRGVEDFKRMCEEKSGNVAAITGWKNEDIKDEQYLMFLKYAWSKGTRLHCLGMARESVLKKVPFDYADASSWVHNVNFGRSKAGYKYKKPESMEDYSSQYIDSYLHYMDIQRRLWLKWKDFEKGFVKSPSTKTKEKEC